MSQSSSKTHEAEAEPEPNASTEPNGSRSRSPHDEEILNAFRELDEGATLTTNDLAERFSVVQRTAQNWVKRLHEEGRLVKDTEGKPNLWRLAEDEPQTPVRHPTIAKAERWANKAEQIGDNLMMVAVSLLASAGFVMSLYVADQVAMIAFPFIGTPSVALTATGFGIFGAVLFLLAFVAAVVNILLPKIVKRRVDGHLSEQ